jgi:hypothetical protein
MVQDQSILIQLIEIPCHAFCSLQDVHKMNEQTADAVCASVYVSMFQIDNRWTDFDETWYERYAIGGHPNLVLFNFLQSVTAT